MKIAKNNIQFQNTLVNSFIYLEKWLQKGLKKSEYIEIKFHNTPDNDDSRSYEIILLYYGGRSSKQWLIWKDKLFKALDRQGVSTGFQRYMFAERLLTGDTKATFNQAVLGHITNEEFT